MPLLLLLPAALAAGYYAPDAGARAIGRGGAFTAGVDDASAVYWNPAALPRVAPQVRAELAAVHQAVSFDREDEPGGAEDGGDLFFDPVRNQSPPLPIPHLMVVPELPGERFAAALSFTTPYAPWYEYPADGPQRYSLVESRMVLATLQATAAFAATPWLSVGVGVGGSTLSIDQSLVSATTIGGTDDPGYDVGFRLKATDVFTPTLRAGLRVAPTSDLVAFGASFEAPSRYRARGSATSDFTGNVFYTGDSDIGQVIAVPSAADDDVVVEVALPMIARAGVLVRPTKTLELEADVVLQAWSVLEALTVSEVDLSIDTTGGEPIVVDDDIVLPIRLQDSWSVRLGGELDVGEAWQARAGGFYETSAVPEDTVSVFIPDGNKLGYGVGGSFRTGGRVTLDLGVTQAFVPARDLERSLVWQVTIDPATGAVGYGKTVGNGRLALVTTAVALGATVRLGAGDAAP